MEGLFLIGLIVFFGPAILAIVAMTKASGIAHEVQELRARVAALAADISALRENLSSSAPAPEQEEAPPTAVEPPTAERPVEKDLVAPTPEEAEEAAEEGTGEAETPPSPVAAAAASRAIVSTPPLSPRDKLRNFEEALASRWLVWLGAVAIALGGAFLVKYAIDRGMLGPATRVTLGFTLGLALIFGGEYLRHRPLQKAIAAVRANYVPPALTASGLFTAFASILAAYNLYGLLPPLIAFAGLVAVAALAFGLSLLHGWFVALMGLIGAFAVPALVSVSVPSAWSLFAYLLVVEVSCLAVLRFQTWWWLALATLACTALWPVIWLVTHWQVSDALPLGIYLLATAALFLNLGYGRQRDSAPQDWREEMAQLQLPEALGWIAAVTVAVLAFAVASAAGFSITSIVFVGLVVALYLVMGRRESAFDVLTVVGGATVLAVTAAWTLPARVTLPRPRFQIQGREIGRDVAAPLIPPELFDFTVATVVLGGLVGIGGFVALWGAKRPAIWAAVSAATPVLILVIAYWRIKDFGIDIQWAVMALALALIGVGAASRVARYPERAKLSLPLGFYAAAVVAFLSLAFTMTLQQAWLTVAFSLQLPALAWIHRRVPEKPLEVIGLAVAGVILVRLVFNYNVLDYALTGPPLTSWVVYGYGIPAVMFLWAARMFRGGGVGLLVTLLEAGSLVFAVLLVSLLIRLFIEGTLTSITYSLEEQSLQSIAWLAMGYVLSIHYRRRAHPVSLYGSRILSGVAAAQVLLLQVLASNPLVTHEPVGHYPVVNVLLLAYGVPAAFAFRIAVEETASRLLSGVLAMTGFVLVFVYLSLEVTRSFQGPTLDSAATTNAELYAYSMAWLAYAALLLALGILRKQTILRHASMAVLLISVLKVFLFDMSDLTGLLRAASFLGLGLSLVGIGYLYQRFVFRPPTAQSGGSPANPASVE